MDAVKKIDPQDWMTSEEVRSVMAALGEGKARFVGGCVRNALINAEVEDIDIATAHVPEKVVELLEGAEIKAVPTGIEYGTVTAVMNGQSFEITTLRKDVETDGRRAVVAYTEDWMEDAQRRDFTMNTLLLDMEGNIYDPTGRGLDDLHRRQVIFVGEPAQRIAEDYLRILRLFRFHARYGDGEIDGQALKACQAVADKIDTLSKERITQEFFKIMAVEGPTAILQIMFDHGILNEAQFDNYKPEILSKLCDVQEKFNLTHVPSRLFVLAGLAKENTHRMQEFLLFPKVFLMDIDAISKVLSLGILDNDHLIQTAVYKFGRTATAQGLLIQSAQEHLDLKFLSKPLKLAIGWDVPTFPVSGDDLIKEGINPGPELGEELQRREDEWIANGFK